MDGPICSYLERESRTFPIASQGQSNDGHLLRPRGDPQTSQLLSTYDRLNGPYETARKFVLSLRS